MLQEKYETLRTLDKEIYQKLETGSHSELDLISQIENVNEYQTLFQKVKAKVKTIYKSSSAEKGVFPSTSNIRKFKLTLLELKKFGDVKEWLPFWTQFLKIHEDSTILSKDKFQYLQQATTISGTRARQVVDSLPLSRDD